MKEILSDPLNANIKAVDGWMVAMCIFTVIVIILYAISCTKWFEDFITNFPNNVKAYIAWYIKKFKKWRSKK